MRDAPAPPASDERSAQAALQRAGPLPTRLPRRSIRVACSGSRARPPARLCRSARPDRRGHRLPPDHARPRPLRPAAAAAAPGHRAVQPRALSTAPDTGPAGQHSARPPGPCKTELCFQKLCRFSGYPTPRFQEMLQPHSCMKRHSACPQQPDQNVRLSSLYTPRETTAEEAMLNSSSTRPQVHT